MKFLIFTSELKFSGPNNVILSLVSGLNKIGIETVVCGLRNREDPLYKEKLLSLGASVECMGKNDNLITFIYKKIKLHNPDVVNSHGIRADVALLLISKFVKNKIISTIHNVPYEDYTSRYDGILSKIMLLCHSQVFKSKRICKVAVSNNVKTCLEKNGAHNVLTIYNGVISDGYNNNSFSREELESKLKLSPNRKRFIFCGHLTEIKQPLIIKELSVFFPQYDFIILGDGPLKEDMISDNDNLILKGRVSNVSEYMAVSDFFIMPSLTEGMPMAFIEALFSNLYPICSNIPIFKELNNIPNISMSLFDVGNVDSLKTNIELIDFSLKNNNYDIANKYFSDVAMSTQYVKVVTSE
ncbi:glycosyltransferase [Vibrio gangliei]|uniref:glycosyltransferase n=1 Tax=Vibrio gangliei TaxID=2077090 RepID=UPI000D01BFC1|nr:glycosyltransferase [Vibrio gangliei]